MSEKDQERKFLPTEAVRFWSKKYATNRQYQRRDGGRLVKIEQKPTSEEILSPQYNLAELAQASSLSLPEFKEVYSEPVTRTPSVSSLHETRLERKTSVGDIELGGDGLSSSLEDFRSLEHLDSVELFGTTDEMAEVEAALKKLAVSIEKDNSKLLPPLPYFNGKCEKANSAST